MDACPTLKTLRITGLNSAGSFIAEIEDALRSSGAGSDDAPDFATPYLPPRLKALVLQAGPVPDPGLGKVVSLKDSIMMDGLESLRWGKADEHSPYVFVPKRAFRPLSIEDMKYEWVAGIRSPS